MPKRKAEPEEKADLDHDKIDQALVDETVEFISKTLAETVYQGAIMVGDHVLQHFFNNDVELARSKDPYKNASFRTLAEKCGTAQLPISKSWLHNAVGAAMMRRLLPEAKSAYKQLPPSHQVTLLPLRDDPAKVEKLADRALSKELSVRDLKVEVEKELAKTPKEGEKRGRKPTPLIVKTLSHSLKLFTLEGGKRSFTKAQVDQLDKDQTRKALKEAQGLVASLNKLIEKLEAKG